MIWWLALLACDGDPGSEADTDTDTDADTDSDSDADSDADTDTDSDADTDSDTDTDTEPDTGQDTALPPDPTCAALEITVDGAPYLGTIDIPGTRAFGDARTVAVDLFNPCSTSVQFLGNPDDWASDPRVTVYPFPPVRLEPGETASFGVTFLPGDEGPFTASIVLPHTADDAPFDPVVTATVGPPPALILTGDGRRVSISPDYGVTWTHDAWDTTEVHTNALQRGVCAGPSGLLTVGGSDLFAHWFSTDGGQTWADDSQSGGWAGGCVWTGSEWWVAGGADQVRRSTDGHTFTGTPSYGTHTRGATWGGGVMVAYGDQTLRTTDDGVSWSHVEEVGDAMNDVAFGHGVFVAGGSSNLVSHDLGQTWQPISSSMGVVRRVVFANGVFFADNGASVFRSDDGETWTVVNATGGVNLLGGYGQRLIGTSGSTVYRSDDQGFTWQVVKPADDGPGLGRGAWGEW